MCTAITYNSASHYFGRNLDLEYHYDEKVTICPHGYKFYFSNEGIVVHNYAIIGMAYVVDNYPLFYDAVNEKGLAMAGLRFQEYAFYGEKKDGMFNIAPYEFIPWILRQCRNIQEALIILKNTNVVNENFSENLPASPLHWRISDKTGSVTVEVVKDGMKIYHNKVGVLTNNPCFEEQLSSLNSYTKLPGDFSSTSRFIKAAYVKRKSIDDGTESGGVNQFFHILSSVEMPKGCVRTEDEKVKYTIYSSCCDLDEIIYYYTTYEKKQPTALRLFDNNLEGDELIKFKLII